MSGRVQRAVRRAVTLLLVLAVWAGVSIDVRAEESPWLAPVMSDADRRHLLARTGIGVAPAHYLALAGLTRREGIERIVAGLATEPGTPMPAWVRRALPRYHTRRNLSDEARQQFRRDRDTEFASLRTWWANEMLRTESPQTERLVMLWHDLVPSDYRSSGSLPVALARQNALYRRLHGARWEDMLDALLKDAALLSYLDANANRRDSPNENLARELLERFTLGEGNYQEQDVREAARALTGLGIAWTRDVQFHLRTGQQDRDPKTLFGFSGAHDAQDLVDLILAQPAAARHLVRVYWAAFISDRPPNGAQVERLAERFRRSDHDLGVLYRTILSSEEFWAPQHRAALVKSPVDVVSGLMRTLEYPKRHWQQALALQDAMGMALFEPPNVAGWDEGDAFVSTGRLLARQRGVRQLLEAGIGAGTDGREGMQQDRQQDGMQDGMQDGIQATAATSMMMSGPAGDEAEARPAAASGKLLLHIASESYQGEAEIRVLLQRADEVLWDGGSMLLSGGYDTARLGRVPERAALPWQALALPAPPEAIAAADTVRVLFLNDAADVDGDRNVYLDRVTLGQRTLVAADGVQQSSCVPESPIDAGNLYCGGQITLSGAAAPMRNAQRTALGHAQAPVASGLMLHSLSEKDDGRIIAGLILDDVHLAERHWPLLQFRLVTWPDRPARLQLGSLDCHDGCLSYWPECAWQDEHYAPRRTLRVSLQPHERANDACLAQIREPSDRALIDTLAASAEIATAWLLEQRQPSSERHRDALQRVHRRVAPNVGSAEKTAASANGRPSANPGDNLGKRPQPDRVLTIDPRVAPVHAPPSPFVPVVPLVATPDALEHALAASNLDPASLLWPGLEGIDAAMQQADGASEGDAPLQQRVRMVTRHPAFQLR